MSLALELIRKSLQRQFAYRAANLAGFATNLFFGVLRASLFIGVYGTQTTVAGYSRQAAITFTALSQAYLSFMFMFGWWDLIRVIKSGDIASSLLRPVDLFAWWWWQDVGRALVQVLWRGLPIVVLFALFYGILLPPSLAHWLAMLAAMFIGLLTSFSWRFLVSLSAFWTQDAIGIGRLAWGLSNLLSGFLIPVAYFPDWLRTAVRFTPFPAMINTPIEIFLGLIPARALPLALVEQSLWAVALVGLCYLVQTAGLRKLVIHGG